MSLSTFGDDKGGNGGASAAHAQAPKLRGAAHYAEWRRDMDVYLERCGVKGVHTRKITPTDWKRYIESVQQWEDEKLEEALKLFGLGDFDEVVEAKKDKDESSSSSVASGSTSAATRKADMRKTVTAMVNTSKNVYALLFAALPEELRNQAGTSVPRGLAYGLWHWLENKFQSTEQDSVGALLEKFFQLRQEDDESYDAYRSRVLALSTLLEHAKEKPSCNMMSLVLTDRLTPRYNTVVLALKAGGKLKDAANIDWEDITHQINSHERSELRAGGEGVASVSRGAWANAAAKGSYSSGSTGGKDVPWYKTPEYLAHLKTVKCNSCGDLGHMAKFCKSGKDRDQSATTYKKVQFKKNSEKAASAVKCRNVALSHPL